MYYYIAEPVTTQTERRRLDSIKSLLSQLGIAGEFAVASPARTVEEHLELAFSKGFTTIVAVGSDALVSRVAGSLLSHQYDQAVLGAIPFQANQALAAMVGAIDLSQLAESLRVRQTVDIDAIQFGRQKAAITEVSVTLTEPTEFHLRYGDVLAQGQLTNMTIQPTGEIKIWQRPAGHSVNLFSRLFQARDSSDDSTLTHLFLEGWDFATQAPCFLTVGGETIAETPFEAIRRQKVLKLIVKRATITPVKDQND